MKLGLKLLAGLFLLVCTVKNADSSHIMGGEITWKCLSNDSLEVQIVLLRDCKGIKYAAPWLGAKSNTHKLNYKAKLVSIKDVTPVCDQSCSICDGWGCTFLYGVQEIVYKVVLDLSQFRKGNSCWLDLSYSSSKRNLAISTGASGQGFYMDSRMNICTDQCNNSPTWKSNGSWTLLCQGVDIVLNHATRMHDKDSQGVFMDSLVYSLGTPMQSETTPTTWNSPYRDTLPIYFLGFPKNAKKLPQGLHLYPETGDLVFRPMKEEITVLTFNIEEYRDDSLIAEYNRHIQIAVIKCPSNKPPVISGIDCSTSTKLNMTACVGDEISFSMCASDPKKDSVKLRLISTGGSDVNFKTVNTWSKKPEGEITWKIDSSDMVNSPIEFLFEATDDVCPIMGRTTKRIWVMVNSPDSLEVKISAPLVDTTCGRFLLTADIKKGKTIDNYYWIVNDSSLSEQDSFSFTPTSTDTQFIKLILKRNGCFHAFYDTIVPLPFKPMRVLPFAITTICSGFGMKDSIRVRGGHGKHVITWQHLNSSNSAKWRDTATIIKTLAMKKGDHILIKVKDSLGCIAEKKVPMLVLETLAINLVSDEIKCSSDSVVIKLPVFKGRGKWNGSGVDGNYFRSSLIVPGKHQISFILQGDSFCVSDAAEITFDTIPIIQLDTFIKTCYEHDQIPLKARPSGGSWLGTGVVKDSFFLKNTNNTRELFPLQYVYMSQLGCAADTMDITVDVGGVTGHMWAGPDGKTLCSGDKELFLQTNTLKNVTSSDSRVRYNKQWYAHKWSMKVGQNKILIKGVDSNHCKVQDHWDVNYQESPKLKVITTTQTLCFDADSIKLETREEDVTWSGTGIEQRGNENYFFPSKGSVDSNSLTATRFNTSLSCSTQRALIFQVKDTIVTSFQTDTSVCVTEDITLPQFTYLGSWIGSGAKFVVTQKNERTFFRTSSKDSGRYQFYFKGTDNKYCFRYDTSTVEVKRKPAFLTTSQFKACDDADSLYLSAPYPEALWLGNDVQLKGEDYFVTPISMDTGSFTIRSFRQKDGCSSDTLLSSLKIIPLPEVDAGIDEPICYPTSSKDTLRYFFSNTDGDWSGNGVVQIDGYYYAEFLSTDAQGPYDYIVEETSKQTGCRNEDTLTLYLGRKVTVDFEATPTWGLAPLEVDFKKTASNSFEQLWRIGAVDSSSAENPTYTFAQAGKYDVSIVAYDSLRQCSSQVLKTDFIQVITNTGIGTLDVGFSVFPNPTTALLMVATEEYINTTYSILDISGKVIDKGMLQGQEHQIDVTALPNGKYFIEFQYKSKPHKVPFVKL